MNKSNQARKVYSMRKLKALSTVGTLGMLVAGSLVFGSAPAATAATVLACGTLPQIPFRAPLSSPPGFEKGGFCNLTPRCPEREPQRCPVRGPTPGRIQPSCT